MDQSATLCHLGCKNENSEIFTHASRTNLVRRFADRHHAQPVTPLQYFQRDTQIANGIDVRFGLQHDGESRSGLLHGVVGLHLRHE